MMLCLQSPTALQLHAPEVGVGETGVGGIASLGLRDPTRAQAEPMTCGASSVASHGGFTRLGVFFLGPYSKGILLVGGPLITGGPFLSPTGTPSSPSACRRQPLHPRSPQASARSPWTNQDGAITPYNPLKEPFIGCIIGILGPNGPSWKAG